MPGQFSVRNFAAGNVSIPIHAVPEAIDTDFYRPGLRPLKMPFERPPFLFMSVFKWEKRKGWDLLVRYWHRNQTPRWRHLYSEAW